MKSYPLDIINLLLPTVISPTSIAFNSEKHSIIDYMGRNLTISVSKGEGYLDSEDFEDNSSSKFVKTIKTPNDDPDDRLNELTQELKKLCETVNDFQIDNFALNWGINEASDPYLIDCDESTFIPNCNLIDIEEFSKIGIFIISEYCLKITPNECITHGKKCLGGTHSIERSVVVSTKIKQLVSCLDCLDQKASYQYLRSHIYSILGTQILVNVPVCNNCFEYYKQRGKKTSDLRKRKTSRSISRPGTSYSAKTTNRIVSHSSISTSRRMTSSYSIDSTTPSGLRVMQDYNVRNTHQARKIYGLQPLSRPKPPPFDYSAYHYL